MGGTGRGVEEQFFFLVPIHKLKFDTLHRLNAKPTYNFSTNILSGMKVIIVVV